MSGKVLVVGAGRMGFGVIKTLISKGYTVMVSDPSNEAVARAVNIGAEGVVNFEEAIGESSTIIFSLPGPVQVNEMTERISLLGVNHRPLIIDLSTIDPQTAIDAGKKCRSNGLRYIEAPVSGGPGGAESGTLSIMVGASEEDYQQVKPILNDIGKNIFYLGDIGTASIAKICNNIVVATTTTILSEAFILASAGGIQPEKLKEILDNSVGGSKTLEVFGKHLVSGDYSNPTFALGLMHKDVGLFSEAIKQYGLTSLMGSLTCQIYNGARSQGFEHEDHTSICKLLEQINNKKIDRSIPVVK
ncbi:NAD(P)-dependent oxidoreductase [Mesobacillus maritimus]|uniref:NAD(P)-dependent oxidoreductase n=1 Tax=Mesobacillus maritimus TaxID=1643336 RepID=UPI00204181BD|nr:NAD(P)-dependent oxidoreductase [Mesobacillus maritimus]MCM3584977.1 NAD(P)-dependent oxidoreductase [Mesobacillus maritimus]